jgi:hypothetical protein
MRLNKVSTSLEPAVFESPSPPSFANHSRRVIGSTANLLARIHVISGGSKTARSPRLAVSHGCSDVTTS